MATHSLPPHMQAPKAKRARSDPSKLPPHNGAGCINTLVNMPADPAAAAAVAVLGLVSSGAYEAKAQALIGDLQHALSGLDELQLDLTPLQSLISRPTDWTGNTELMNKAEELVTAAAQQRPVSDGSAARGIPEIQRDIDDTHSMLSLVGGLAEHRRARLQSEADGFIAELHARQESEQQAAAFTSGQAMRIQEVREMLKAEIENHEEAVQLAASLHRLMGMGRIFL